MSDTWKDILDFKSRQSSLKEKLQKRKQERQGLLNLATSAKPVTLPIHHNSSGDSSNLSENDKGLKEKVLNDLDSKQIEERLLQCLCDVLLTLPVDSRALYKTVSSTISHDVSYDIVENLLQKFAAQALISVKEGTTSDGKPCLIILSTEHDKLVAVSNELLGISASKASDDDVKDSQDDEVQEPHSKVIVVQKDEKKSKDKDILSLLSKPSIREKENKKMGEEILDLLSKPTAKERSLAERFRSQGGAQVQEFCPHGTKDECNKMANGVKSCHKLHFRKIIQKHTDESLGDCSFLNTCFHMDTCKYVHYEVDSASQPSKEMNNIKKEIRITPHPREATILYKPQWIQCDLRYFDMTVLGKFAVVMADPPWDIHMELPYGTMSDDEMRALNIPCLQDEGLIFLWVTGRAMELGRECLTLWGYERVDELIWVKTNQLQRIIRTGRTGHWLNHGKEHCLVGMKGSPDSLNRGLDCDVIVAEVRATSHKPDEIYGIIERLSPGTRKIELFGRQHNVQPNWITLGNQLDGVRLLDPELVKNYQPRYPDGICMGPGKGN